MNEMYVTVIDLPDLKLDQLVLFMSSIEMKIKSSEDINEIIALTKLYEKTKLVKIDLEIKMENLEKIGVEND